jgi:selenocysteine lyase/cysteine desulfurase
VTPLPREQFPVVERYRYFDHAGIAPITKAAGDAMRWWTDRYERQGSLDYDELEMRMDRARRSAAALCGVRVDDLAFVKNTTEGLGFVASGLRWQRGDRVVVPDREFPSTIYPWLSLRDLGVEVDRVTPEGEGGALAVDAFASVIASGRPPKVVATSWVHYGRGWRTDLERLADVCHDNGALLCVDAMQGVGVIPAHFATWNVDFAVVGPHKWLCAPRGVGIFYVAPGVRDRLRPLEPGWASVAHRGAWTNLDLVWDGSARRFEGGSPNEAGIVALGASIDVLLRAGIDRVWNHVDMLCDRLIDGLRALGRVRFLSDRSAEGRSAIVTFAVDGVPSTDVAAYLQRERFACAPRGGGIRLSPHGYMDESDVDALVESVTGLLQP